VKPGDRVIYFRRIGGAEYAKLDVEIIKLNPKTAKVRLARTGEIKNVFLENIGVPRDT
jgi:hypothetical protein